MLVSLCALGLAQGMRHALEPDHLAAVTTLATEGRSARRVVSFAALWGAGHASMLFLVGGALYLARVEMPEHVASALEFGVALMLVALGVRGMTRAARLGAASHPSPSAAPGHAHAPHPPAHVHVGGRALAVLPFGVGLVHGLAGSGALAAMLMGSQPHLGMGVAVLAVYSLGTVLGMALLAGLLGKPLQKLAATQRVHRWVLTTSGLLSLVVGLLWGALVLGFA